MEFEVMLAPYINYSFFTKGVKRWGEKILESFSVEKSRIPRGLGDPAFKIGKNALFKEIVHAQNKKHEDYAGQNVGHVAPHPPFYLQSLAGVCLGDEAVPAPAAL